MDESFSAESFQRKAFEDEIQSSLNTILASDERRRAAFQLAHDEEQQNVAVSNIFSAVVKFSLFCAGLLPWLPL